MSRLLFLFKYTKNEQSMEFFSNYIISKNCDFVILYMMFYCFKEVRIPGISICNLDLVPLHTLYLTIIPTIAEHHKDLDKSCFYIALQSADQEAMAY